MNSFNSINLISSEKKNIKIEDLFKNSLSIEGVARTGKSTLLFNGIESKIKENKNIIVIHNNNNNTNILKELSKKYNKENIFTNYTSCSNNEKNILNDLEKDNFIISLNLDDINEKDDQTIILSILINSNFKNKEINIFIDNKYQITSSPLLEILISVSKIINLNIFIVSNDLTDIIFDNLKQHIVFNMNDNSKKERILNSFNLKIFPSNLSIGEFIYHINDELYFCKF